MTLVPYDCVPIAVDLIEGATPLPDFEHPERAFYVFGPEDGTLGKPVLSKCKETIYVPAGRACMNLAATVNVILYDRLIKGRTNQ
jgi:tRNA(Leu) C34 or U34 (ribose-2'-O)-methylase TrmL